jgi:hypothetical protein
MATGGGGQTSPQRITAEEAKRIRELMELYYNQMAAEGRRQPIR